MIEIDGDHVLALIVGFLKRYGEEKLAAKVQDKIVDPEELDQVPLVKKKLEKIIQGYVLENKQELGLFRALVKYYEKKQKKQTSEEEEEQEESKIKKRKRNQSHSKELKESKRKTSNAKSEQEEKPKTGIYSKFTKAKLLQTTIQKIEVQEEPEQSEQEQKVSKKKAKSEKKQDKKQKKAQKVVKKQTSSQQESEEQKPKPKKTQPKAKKPKSQSQSQQSEQQKQKPVKKIEKKEQKPVVKPIQPKITAAYNDEEEQQYPRQKKFFSRIDPSKIAPLPANLRDNTFEAKFKFGTTGDDWGKYGNQKLKNERGDGFKKMKGKLKNKDFQGGTIDPYAVNSISLL